MKKLLCVLSLLILFGCHKAEDAKDVIAYDDDLISDVHEPLAERTGERKLIQNGSISFEVADVSKARKDIMLLTNDTGGYVASEKSSISDDNQPRYEQTVRIPGDRLNDFISKIESLATKIHDKELTAEDVTEEYIDLESRLVVQKELEARFREIVKQAKTVKEVLEVEKEISNVRNDIESIQGRLKYLSNQTSYSTIQLTYYEANSIVAPGIGSKFAESFIGGWNSLVSFMVALTRTWPFLAIIGLGTWLLIHRRRKESKQPLQS